MQLKIPLVETEANWFTHALSALNVNQNSGWPDRFGRNLRNHVRHRLAQEVRVLSLFSGGGGLDIGFHDAGFSIVECNEIERDFAATLERNASVGGYLDGTRILCKDIREYVPDVGQVDFIIGGPPCQTFSAAGARAAGVQGLDDDRGNLFVEYARILKQLSPRGFLFENVYRLVGAQGGRAWLNVQQAFRSLGYKLYWRILDAADFGAPQFRERLFIVGIKEGEYRFPFPTHGPDSADRRPYYTSGLAVHGIDVMGCKVGLGGRHGHLLNGIPPGLNYSFYTEKLGHPEPIFGWRSKFSDYLYKADPGRPVRTIKAQGGQYTGPFSWENRVFTIDEIKRLQTFPDEYEVVGNRQKAVHQLGNSVPPQLARILAISILDQLFGAKLGFPVEGMPVDLVLGFRKRKAQLTTHYSRVATEAIRKIANQPSVRPSFEQEATSFGVSDDFRLVFPGQRRGSSDFYGSVTRDCRDWTISVLDRRRRSLAYRMTIEVRRSVSESIDADTIKMDICSIRPLSILAAWKYFEYLLKKYSPKDDLVQFFGYYQYKQEHQVRAECVAKGLKASSFWQLWAKITDGIGTGQIMHSQEFSQIYELPWNDIYEGFVELKKFGYEIRSHNTNQQIPKGSFLVPYSFPSLTERSLQRIARI